MSVIKKIAVLVSGGGTNLQALIDAQNSGILKSGKIVAVISSCEDALMLFNAPQTPIFRPSSCRGKDIQKRNSIKIF